MINSNHPLAVAGKVSEEAIREQVQESFDDLDSFLRGKNFVTKFSKLRDRLFMLKTRRRNRGGVSSDSDSASESDRPVDHIRPKRKPSNSALWLSDESGLNPKKKTKSSNRMRTHNQRHSPMSDDGVPNIL